MIWRLLVLWSVFSVYAYVDGTVGRAAAWAATDVLAILLLPLSAIERRLAALVRTTQRTAGK